MIDSYTYEGLITGDMMAVKKDFIAKNNLDTFSLIASVYTNGKLVDRSEMQYDCMRIDPSICQKNTTRIPFLLLLSGLFIIFLIGYIFWKIKHKSSTISSLIFFIVLSAFWIYPYHVEAKSVSWSNTVNKYFFYFYNE